MNDERQQVLVAASERLGDRLTAAGVAESVIAELRRQMRTVGAGSGEAVRTVHLLEAVGATYGPQCNAPVSAALQKAIRECVALLKPPEPPQRAAGNVATARQE